MLDQLVRPVLDAFRRGRIPIDNWWRPLDLVMVILPCFARWRLTEVSKQALHSELTGRWRLVPADAEEILGEAGAQDPIVPVLLAASPRDSFLDEFWRRPDIVEALRSERAAMDQRKAVNRAVADLREAVVRFRVLVDRRKELAAVHPRLPAELAQAEEDLSHALAQLTVYEAGFIRPRDHEDELLRAAADSMRNSVFASTAGSNAPADGYLGELLVPNWLTEYLVSAGGRLGHMSCGPIPYWYMALEGDELPDELAGGVRGIALAINDEPDGLAEIYRVFHVRGEDRHGGFTFASGHLDDVIQLALIALCGFIRIDTFLISPDGLLELIESARIDISESPIGDHLRRAALVALEGRPPDPNKILNAWFQQLASETGAGGFLASDHAKSEELLGLTISPSDGVNPDDAYLTKYREARDHLLALLDLRARQSVLTVETDADLDSEIKSAQADYRFAVTNLGPLGSRRPGGTDVPSLVEGIVDSRHAFLHLNRTPEHLDAFLCQHTDSGLVTQRLDVSTTQLRSVEQSLLAWEPGEPASLERAMGAVGSDIGLTLVEALASSPQVEHLYVSPVGFLNALPFSQLPIPGGTLGEWLSISYTPSARVLQRLRGSRVQDARRTLALAHHDDGDIELTSSEVAIVAELYEETLLLDGADATPARFLRESSSRSLLHLACHGTWRPGDGYGSGLHLAGHDPSTGFLSMARVHRDADLADTDLAILSACDSGRATQFWPEIQNYSGIDGAFLARGTTAVISSLWEVMDVAGLLFMTVLHQRLATGAPILDAFASARAFLSDGGYQKPDTSVQDLLERHAPGWESAVAELGYELMDPYYWAVFKLSGFVRR